MGEEESGQELMNDMNMTTFISFLSIPPTNQACILLSIWSSQTPSHDVVTCHSKGILVGVIM